MIEMENLELLALIKEDVTQMKHMNNFQKNDLAFKMAALNENFAGIYFGALEGSNMEQNKIIFAKSLEFYKNIGKDNFFGETKNIVDKICNENSYLAGRFELSKSSFLENHKNFRYDELLMNGDFRHKNKVLEMLHWAPLEYINIGKSWKSDPDVIKKVLERIEPYPKFETQEIYDKKLAAFKRQIQGANVPLSEILKEGTSNPFLGTLFSNELKQVMKNKNAVQAMRKAFKENPVFMLCSGLYQKENERKVIDMAVNYSLEQTQDEALRNFMLMKNYLEKNRESKQIKEFLSDADFFCKLDFEKVPARFIGLAEQEVLKNPEIILKALAKEKNIFKFLPDEIKADRRIALDFVGIAGKNYRILNEELKNDKEICELAVGRSAKMYYYMPQEMKKDIDVATLAINKDKWSWFLMDDSMKKNPEVLNCMRTENPSPLLSEAFKLQAKAMGMEATSLKNKKALFRELIAQNPEMIIEIPKSAATEELWHLALSKNIELYKDMPEKLKSDERVLETVIKEKSKQKVK